MDAFAVIINLRSWKVPLCHNDATAHASRYDYPYATGYNKPKDVNAYCSFSRHLKFSTFQIGTKCAKRSFEKSRVPHNMPSLLRTLRTFVTAKVARNFEMAKKMAKKFDD